MADARNMAWGPTSPMATALPPPAAASPAAEPPPQRSPEPPRSEPPRRPTKREYGSQLVVDEFELEGRDGRLYKGAQSGLVLTGFTKEEMVDLAPSELLAAAEAAGVVDLMHKSTTVPAARGRPASAAVKIRSARARPASAAAAKGGAGGYGLAGIGAAGWQGGNGVSLSSCSCAGVAAAAQQQVAAADFRHQQQVFTRRGAGARPQSAAPAMIARRQNSR